MKIYTKAGDAGDTGLLGGDRIPKDSARIEAIGAFDELNAYVGICILHADDSDTKGKLTRLQNQIFEIGSELACPPGGKFDLSSVTAEDILELEREIDAMDADLPELKVFILPGGAPLGAHLHFLRTLCRRTERTLLALHHINPVRNELIMYVNRLSDWIFCLSRLVNLRSGVEEHRWSKGVK